MARHDLDQGKPEFSGEWEYSPAWELAVDCLPILICFATAALPFVLLAFGVK